MAENRPVHSDFSGQIIVHIGPHKTGSTSIQRCLSDNYESLAAKGFLYPKAGRREKGRLTHLHHPLALAVAEGSKPAVAAILSDLADEIAGHGPDRIFLSSEVLAREKLSARVFSDLRALFPHAGVSWLLYVRRQDDLLVSRYAEAIKRGLVAWPDDVLTLDQPKFLDHRLRIEKLRQAVPDDPLIVASFDAEKRHLIPALFERLGLPTDGLDEAEVHANRSMPWGVLSVLRRTNALPRPVGTPLAALARLAGRILPRSAVAWGTPITDAERQAVRERYRESNLWVERVYFGTEPVLTNQRSDPE